MTDKHDSEPESSEEPELMASQPVPCVRDSLQSVLDQHQNELSLLASRLGVAKTKSERLSLAKDLEAINTVIKEVKESLRLTQTFHEACVRGVGTAEGSTSKYSKGESRRVPNLPSIHPTYRCAGKDEYKDMKLFLEAAETCFRSIGLPREHYIFKLAAMMDRTTRKWLESELLDVDYEPRFPYNECKRRLIDEFKHSKTRQEAVIKLNRFDWAASKGVQANVRAFLLLMEDAGVPEADEQRLDQLHYLLPTELYVPVQAYRVTEQNKIEIGARDNAITVREIGKIAASYCRKEVESRVMDGLRKSQSSKDNKGAAQFLTKPSYNKGGLEKKRREREKPQRVALSEPRKEREASKTPGKKKTVVCFNCQEPGHYADKCPRKDTPRVAAVRRGSEDSAEQRIAPEFDDVYQEMLRDMRCAAVARRDQVRDNRVTVPITLNGHRALALLDTGASHTLVDGGWAKKRGLEFEMAPKEFMLAAEGATMKSEGNVKQALIRAANKRVIVDVEVAPLRGPETVYLGRDALPALGLMPVNIPFTYPDGDDSYCRSIVDEISAKPELTATATAEERAKWVEELEPELTLCEQLSGFCKHPLSEVAIPTTTYTRPIYTAQYPMPKSIIPTIKEKILDLKTRGIIREAPQDCKWNSPWITAPKKDEEGRKVDVRFCVDYRKINRALVGEDEHSLPLIRQDILSAVAGATWFSKIDLSEGYHQFRIKEEDQPKTAFTFEGTQYMYVGAPFGFKHLPSVFQRTMQQVLKGIPWVKVYIDDVIIFTQGSRGEHRTTVREVLRRLVQQNLRLKRKKCEFFAKTMNILGHIVDTEGIRPDPSKVEHALRWPRPRNAKDIQAFMGLVNYFAEHLPALAHVARPLNEKRNNKKFDGRRH